MKESSARSLSWFVGLVVKYVLHAMDANGRCFSEGSFEQEGTSEIKEFQKEQSLQSVDKTNL